MSKTSNCFILHGIKTSLFPYCMKINTSLLTVYYNGDGVLPENAQDLRLSPFYWQLHMYIVHRTLNKLYLLTDRAAQFPRGKYSLKQMCWPRKCNVHIAYKVFFGRNIGCSLYSCLGTCPSSCANFCNPTLPKQLP